MNQEVLYNYKRKTNPKGQDKKGTSAENDIKEYTAKRKRNNHSSEDGIRDSYSTMNVV